MLLLFCRLHITNKNAQDSSFCVKYFKLRNDGKIVFLDEIIICHLTTQGLLMTHYLSNVYCNNIRWNQQIIYKPFKSIG